MLDKVYNMEGGASANTVDEQIEFSVLMSVYYQEKAEYLNDSLSSIFSQTYPAEQVVLVCDGLLTASLDEVIASYEKQYPDILQVIRKEKNEGLGLALREGLEHCRNEWVSRMDADDLSLPNRFEKQIAYIQAHPETDVLGTSITEFNIKEGTSHFQRLLPQKQEDIEAFAKKRNPFNHVSLMFKKSVILAAGSYIDFPLFEDYHLIVRLIQHKACLHNLAESLVLVRFNNKTLSRRRGWDYFKKEYAFMKECYRLKFLSKWEFLRNISIRSILRALPMKFLFWIYRTMLRTEA